MKIFHRLVWPVRRWWWSRVLCPGCGNPKRRGAHGMSEFGGCV